MKHHPEQQDDEIYLGNAIPNTLYKSSWTSSRLGMNPLMQNGQPYTGGGLLPWFIKRAEVERAINDNNRAALQEMLDKGSALYTDMKTHDHGEPWRYCIEDHPFVVNNRDELVIEKTDENMGDVDIHRAILCVNECAGIDPAAALTAAREALEAEELWRNQRDDTGTLRAIATEKRLKAINLLTPASTSPKTHGVHSACFDGEGWVLYDQDSSLIDEWPKGWPDTVNASFMKAQGVEVAP